MKLGLIARGDNTGLGHQTKMYFDWLKPAKTLLIDFSEVNKQMGKDTKFYPTRFPGARICGGYPTIEDLEWLLAGIDVVFTAETPYNHELFDLARQRGVKSVLHYNFEFLGNLQDDLPFPDLLLAPSMWRVEEVQKLAKEHGVRWAYLPLGVDRQMFPFRHRNKAETFVHCGGIPAHKDRNGTLILLDALKYVTQPMEVKIFTQGKLPRPSIADCVKLEVIEGEIDDNKAFYDGDVFVFPRKYGGQSLPLNEALSSGLAVLMSDCLPHSSFLHPASLLPCRDGETIRAKAVIDVYEADPRILAQRMDDLVRNPELVSELSRHSDKLAQNIDWHTLVDRYDELFHGIL